MIEYECPECFELMQSPDELAGCVEVCPDCGTHVPVPQNSETVAPSESLADLVTGPPAAKSPNRVPSVPPTPQQNPTTGENDGKIHYRCGSCDKPIRVDEKYAGQKCKCPRCGDRGTIPGEPVGVFATTSTRNKHLLLLVLGIAAIFSLFARGYNDFILEPQKEQILQELIENRRFNQSELPKLLLELELYVDKKHNFSIRFPEGWTVKEALMPGRSIVIKAIHRGEQAELANLIIYAYGADDIAINTATATARECFDASGLVASRDYIDGGETRLAGKRAIWIMSKGKDDSFFTISYYLTRDDTLFCLSGGTVLGGKEWFQKNKQRMVTAIKSFKFLGAGE